MLWLAKYSIVFFTRELKFARFDWLKISTVTELSFWCGIENANDDIIFSCELMWGASLVNWEKISMDPDYPDYGRATSNSESEPCPGLVDYVMMT